MLGTPGQSDYFEAVTPAQVEERCFGRGPGLRVQNLVGIDCFLATGVGPFEFTFESATRRKFRGQQPQQCEVGIH